MSKPRRLAAYWRYRHYVLMLLPALVYFLVFKYLPMYGVIISFQDYKLLKGVSGSEWIGLENFRLMIEGRDFWRVFRNTIVISAYRLIFAFPAPVLFALLLSEILNTRFKKVVQTISYLPHFLSWVVLAGIFTQFLSPTMGPVNVIIERLGFRPIYFLGDSRVFRFTLIATDVWKGFGWGSIVYIAALSNVDPSLYESAVVDGANRFQKAIYITVPALMPVVTVMFILTAGRIITVGFDQVFNMYNPAVYDVGDIIATYTYRKGIESLRYSFATAVGLFQNVIAFMILVVVNGIARRFNEYGLW